MLNLRIDVLHFDTQPNAPVGTLTLQIPTGAYELTPEVLATRLQHLAPGIRLTFNACIEGDGTLLTIRGFEYFSLVAFANKTASFPSLHIHGATDFFRLNNLKIDRLDSDVSNALVCDCEIIEFNVGPDTHYQRLLAGDDTPLDLVGTDVRGGSINRLRAFVPQSTINLQGCELSSVRLMGHSSQAKLIRVWQACRIRNLTFESTVDAIEIRSSVVDSLFFSAAAKLGRLTVESGAITQTYGAAFDSFVESSMETSKLIVASARNAHDPNLLAAASYRYAVQHRRRHRGRVARTIGWLMDMSCGFGYKPERTVVFAFVVWFGMAFVYCLLTLYGRDGIEWKDMSVSSPFETFLRSLYFSATTITTAGFGDVTPRGPVVMLLAGIESSIGIVLFALLVFALSKRFGSD